MNDKDQWLRVLRTQVQYAAAGMENDWPDGWLYLGKSNDTNDDWFDGLELLGLPVYHCPAFLTHGGPSGESQHILPIWTGEPTQERWRLMRDFEKRLAEVSENE